MKIWKTITDYPNYQVSNYGNVKNIRFIVASAFVEIKLKDNIIVKIKNNIVVETIK